MIVNSCLSSNLLQFPCILLELNYPRSLTRRDKNILSEELMFCYSKGMEKAGTEFWSEHGYFMGTQWLRQLCDLLYQDVATTCSIVSTEYSSMCI